MVHGCGCVYRSGGKKKVTSVGAHGGLDARLGAALAEPVGGCVPCNTAPAKYMALSDRTFLSDLCVSIEGPGSLLSPLLHLPQ